MGGVKRKISEVDGAETEAIPAVKDLASSEPKLRRQCLQTILSHLESRSSTSYLTPTQALQLWRGFHVALYMHDSKSAISVQNLITQLSGTFSTIRSKDKELHDQSSVDNHVSQPSGTDPAKSGDDAEGEWNGVGDDDDGNHISTSTDQTLASRSDQTWLSVWSTAFWQTMIREWSNIDQHRINKYLLLIRTVVREIFTICLSCQVESSLPSKTTKAATTSKSQPSKKSKKSNSKSTQIPASGSDLVSTTPSSSSSSTKSTISHPLIKATSTLLQTYPLQPRDSKIPNGLRLHLLDIYVDELFVAATTAVSSFPSTTKSDTDTETKTETEGESNTDKTLLRTSLETLMTPVHSIAKDGLAKNVRTRAKEEIQEFEHRLAEWI